MIERFRNVQLLPREKTVIDEVTKHDLTKKHMLDELAQMIRSHTEVIKSIQKKNVTFNDHPEEVLELDLVVMDYKSFSKMLQLMTGVDGLSAHTWEEFKTTLQTYINSNGY